MTLITAYDFARSHLHYGGMHAASSFRHDAPSMLAGAVLQSGQLITIELPEWLLAMTYMAVGWRIGLGFDETVLLPRHYALPASSFLLCWLFVRVWRGG